MTTNRKTVLITGASSGIGYELAKVFARDGYNLVIVARSEGKLTELAGQLQREQDITVKVMAKDLSDPAAPEEIYRELQQAEIPIEVLVNNAGFASYGLFTEIDLTTELNMIQVNVTALTHLTKLFGREMVKRKSGKVLNVASTAAFQPGPLMAVYYATKAYVLHFSEAIANEMEDFGVTVTALCPGPTESGFQERAEMEDSRLVQRGLMDAKTVAEQGYQALMDGKAVLVPGFPNQMGAFMTRFVPRGAVAGIVRKMQERSQSH
jgi:hypothetical protein